jgi:hypothetical protein
MKSVIRFRRSLTDNFVNIIAARLPALVHDGDALQFINEIFDLAIDLASLRTTFGNHRVNRGARRK